MENGQFDLLLDEIRENRGTLVELLERVVRLEERYRGMSVFWGTLGGLLPAAGIVLWWVATKLPWG